MDVQRIIFEDDIFCLFEIMIDVPPYPKPWPRHCSLYGMYAIVFIINLETVSASVFTKPLKSRKVRQT